MWFPLLHQTFRSCRSVFPNFSSIDEALKYGSFLYHNEPLPVTILQAREADGVETFWRHRRGDSVNILKEHEHSTTTCNLRTRTDENIRKRQLVAHGDYLSIAKIPEKKNRAIFCRVPGIFRRVSVFLFIYATIFAQHLTVFCRNVTERR